MNYQIDLGFLERFEDESAEFSNLDKRFTHAFFIGQTGTGKSCLLEHLANYDIKSGLSVIYLDPKGSSAKKLWSLHQDNPKVKYVSFDNPIKINPLKKIGYSDDELINEFIQIMDILIRQTTPNPDSTVRMMHVLIKAFKGLKETDKNIEFLYKFLTHFDERKSYSFGDLEIKKWWDNLHQAKTKEPQKFSDYIRTMDSISNRLSMFIDNQEMKDVISGENELYIDDLVSKGESLLINTNTPIFDNIIFLSNLIVYAAYTHVFKRELTRKPLLIYIDEFQMVASNLFPLLLQMSRDSLIGFNLSVTDLSQIDKNVFNSVFSNCSSKIGFRCGHLEADILSKYFRTKPEDIMSLPRYKAYVNIDNNIALIETFPPLKAIEAELPIKQPEIPPTQPFYSFLSDEWM